MNQRPTQITRFHIIAALSLALLCVYLVVLFNIQVVHHEDYLAQSIQTITRVENVKASRGIITDRSGRTLVSNQYTYSLTFDPTLLRSGEDQNEAILRLVTLCREQGVAWEDNLPLSLSAPAQFTLDGFTDTQKARFFAYLPSGRLRPDTYRAAQAPGRRLRAAGPHALKGCGACKADRLLPSHHRAAGGHRLHSGAFDAVDACGHEPFRRLYR